MAELQTHFEIVATTQALTFEMAEALARHYGIRTGQRFEVREVAE